MHVRLCKMVWYYQENVVQGCIWNTFLIYENSICIQRNSVKLGELSFIINSFLCKFVFELNFLIQCCISYKRYKIGKPVFISYSLKMVQLTTQHTHSECNSYFFCCYIRFPSFLGLIIY